MIPNSVTDDEANANGSIKRGGSSLRFDGPSAATANSGGSSSGLGDAACEDELAAARPAKRSFSRRVAPQEHAPSIPAAAAAAAAEDAEDNAVAAVFVVGTDREQLAA